MIIPVKTVTGEYNIFLERGALEKASEYLNLDRKVLIVTDDGVPKVYSETVARQSKSPFIVSLCQGEASKSFENFKMLLSKMVEYGFTHTDCVVAVGGGVVGDIAGFAAATYLRGIGYIQVPTTLLAAVDSSVGGKTAIDLDAGKNLVGAFCQPKLVLCDVDTLNTLPRDIFRDGCAEVIKYGILYDPAFFAYLEETGTNFNREAVIARCVELKRDVVALDEFDTGARMKLNLGHTIGHGVEARSNFALSHGKAVAIGMAIVSRASNCVDAPRILGILDRFGLPTTTEYPLEDIYRYTLSDKKRNGGTVNLIIPVKIGHCDIVPTPVEELKSFIQAGL